MPSLFANLFRYSRATDSDPLENFTTEALAACVRDDARPFVTALAASKLIDTHEVTGLSAESQVWIPGVGCIDLVICGHDRTGRFELWIEVKVNAGESGDQLTRYLAGARSRHPARVRVATLGPNAISADADITHVPWQALWHHVHHGAHDSKLWAEFNAHLMENEMADEYDSPVRATEAASMGNAVSLERRTRRIFAKFGARAQEIWPAGNWSSKESDIYWETATQFLRHGRWLVHRPRNKSPYVAAVVYPKTDGEAWLGLWIEADPKSLDVRARLLAHADGAGLDPTVWKRNVKGWQLIAGEVPLIAHREVDGAVAWLVDRLSELRRAGMLEMVSTARQTTLEEPSKVDAPDGALR